MPVPTERSHCTLLSLDQRTKGVGPMCRTLPSHANLADIQHEARELLHRLRSRDAGALRRHQASDPLADAFVPRLGEVQYVIAREYGYGSWQGLKEGLNRRTKIANRARKRERREIFANS